MSLSTIKGLSERGTSRMPGLAGSAVSSWIRWQSPPSLEPLYPQLRSSSIICGNVYPLDETRKAHGGRCEIAVEDLWRPPL